MRLISTRRSSWLQDITLYGTGLQTTNEILAFIKYRQHRSPVSLFFYHFVLLIFFPSHHVFSKNLFYFPISCLYLKYMPVLLFSSQPGLDRSLWNSLAYIPKPKECNSADKHLKINKLKKKKYQNFPFQHKINVNLEAIPHTLSWFIF